MDSPSLVRALRGKEDALGRMEVELERRVAVGLHAEHENSFLRAHHTAATRKLQQEAQRELLDEQQRRKRHERALRDKLARAQRAKEAAEDELAGAKADVAAADTSVAEMQAQLRGALSTVDRQRQEIAMASASLHERDAQAAETRARLEVAEREARTARARADAVESEAVQLRSALDQADGQRRAHLNHHAHKVEELLGQLERRDEAVKRGESELAAARALAIQLQAQLDTRISGLSLSESRVRELEASNAQLRNQAEDRGRRESVLLDEDRAARSEAETLRERLQAQKEMADELKSRVGYLQGRLEAADARTADLDAERSSLTADKLALATERQRLEMEAREKSSEASAAKLHGTQADEELHEAREELAALRAKLSTTFRQRDEIVSRFAPRGSRRQNDALLADAFRMWRFEMVSSKERRVQGQSATHEAFKAQISSLSEQLRQAELETRQAEERAAAATSRQDLLETSVDELQNLTQGLRSEALELAVAKGELKAMTGECERLRGELAEARALYEEHEIEAESRDVSKKDGALEAADRCMAVCQERERLAVVFRAWKDLHVRILIDSLTDILQQADITGLESIKKEKARGFDMARLILQSWRFHWRPASAHVQSHHGVANPSIASSSRRSRGRSRPRSTRSSSRGPRIESSDSESDWWSRGGEAEELVNDPLGPRPPDDYTKELSDVELASIGLNANDLSVEPDDDDGFAPPSPEQQRAEAEAAAITARIERERAAEAVPDAQRWELERRWPLQRLEELTEEATASESGELLRKLIDEICGRLAEEMYFVGEQLTAVVGRARVPSSGYAPRGIAASLSTALLKAGGAGGRRSGQDRDTFLAGARARFHHMLEQVAETSPLRTLVGLYCRAVGGYQRVRSKQPQIRKKSPRRDVTFNIGNRDGERAVVVTYSAALRRCEAVWVKKRRTDERVGMGLEQDLHVKERAHAFAPENRYSMRHPVDSGGGPRHFWSAVCRDTAALRAESLEELENSMWTLLLLLFRFYEHPYDEGLQLDRHEPQRKMLDRQLYLSLIFYVDTLIRDQEQDKEIATLYPKYDPDRPFLNDSAMRSSAAVFDEEE